MYTVYIYIRETTLPTSSTYAHEALTDLLQYWLEDTVDVRESGKSDELSETILRVPSQTVSLPPQQAGSHQTLCQSGRGVTMGTHGILIHIA